MKISARVLQNGTKCYIINMKGFKMKQAMFSVNFGSADSEFLPGTAHFLEHKVFEQKDRNVFAEFSENSADVNAFTNFTTTAYYFSCVRNFEENLKLLLDFTANPYLTDENINKEKGIIAEEIKMYEDDPNWQVYFGLLGTLYEKHPVRNNIAGSLSDIEKIDRNSLIKCYDKYYCGENSALVICGDFEEEKTFELAEKLSKIKRGERPKRKQFEDRGVFKRIVKGGAEVSKTIFNIGFKENDFETPAANRLCDTRLALDIVLGRGTDLYEKLYIDGLIDKDFSMEYLLGSDFGAAVFSGVSERADLVGEAVIKAVSYIKEKGVSERELEASKKRLISAFLRGQNSAYSLAAAQTDYAFKDISFSDIYKRYKSAKAEDITDRLSVFSEENMAVSLIERK